MKNKKLLITKLISNATRIEKSDEPKANYVKIPIENIELVAKELNLSLEETIDILTEYFKPKENNT